MNYILSAILTLFSYSLSAYSDTKGYQVIEECKKLLEEPITNEIRNNSYCIGAIDGISLILNLNCKEGHKEKFSANTRGVKIEELINAIIEDSIEFPGLLNAPFVSMSSIAIAKKFPCKINK